VTLVWGAWAACVVTRIGHACAVARRVTGLWNARRVLAVGCVSDDLSACCPASCALFSIPVRACPYQPIWFTLLLSSSVAHVVSMVKICTPFFIRFAAASSLLTHLSALSVMASCACSVTMYVEHSYTCAHVCVTPDTSGMVLLEVRNCSTTGPTPPRLCSAHLHKELVHNLFCHDRVGEIWNLRLL
jgi:hypothetical protein